MKRVTKYKWYIIHNGVEILTPIRYAEAFDALKAHNIDPYATGTYSIECIHSTEKVEKE